MEIKLNSAKHENGSITLNLKLKDGTKLLLYIYQQENKVEGMYKEVTKNDYIDLNKLEITEDKNDDDE